MRDPRLTPGDAVINLAILARQPSGGQVEAVLAPVYAHTGGAVQVLGTAVYGRQPVDVGELVTWLEQA